jgi:hypothetical protein
MKQPYRPRVEEEFWWCPECQTVVEDEAVTSDEKEAHNPLFNGCGCEVERLGGKAGRRGRNLNVPLSETP